MALTLDEWVTKSVWQARRFLPDANPSRLKVFANALLQEALQKLARDTAADPTTRALLRKTKTVTFTNGSATLSDDVLVEYARDSSLVDVTSTATVNKKYSLETNYDSFLRVYDRRLGYYFIKGHTIQIIEPGVGYVQGSGLNGDRQLLIPTVPDVPATSTDPVDIVVELESDLVAVLADLIVGKASEEASQAA